MVVTQADPTRGRTEFRPIIVSRTVLATFRKIATSPHFGLAEEVDLVNDFCVGRGNVRDGTLQAVM